MGSQSDYSVMKDCEKILRILKIKHQVSIVSAHRTPKRMFEFAESAAKNGFAVIIAGAGGAAHLPGMVASLVTVPVIGVPIESKTLKGLDSLLSIVQMPKGCPRGSQRRFGEDFLSERVRKLNSKATSVKKLIFQKSNGLTPETATGPEGKS